MKLNICNLIIESEYVCDSFLPFRCDDGEAELCFCKTRELVPLSGIEPLVVHDAFSVYKSGDCWLYVTRQGEQLLVDKAYTRGSFRFLPDDDAAAQDARLLVMFRVAVECRLATRGVVSLHSACVEKDGVAVALTGDSGAGKSTRADKWVKTLGAEWLSGDRPLVDAVNKRVFGSPWDGKEQIFRNHSCPLHAIAEIRRSKTARLRRLSLAQARTLLAKQCFIPLWDTETAARILEIIHGFLQDTAVYRLFCDRDEAAARASYALLTEKNRAEREKTDLKIKEGFTLRLIAGEYMVMPTGNNVAKFDGSVALNEVAAFVYECLQNPLSKDELLMLILDEFDVEEAVAEKDLTALLATFNEYGLIDEHP